MSSIKTLSTLASKYEQKYSLGQVASAQSSDIEDALRTAKLFDSPEVSNKVAQLLNMAQVPETSSVNIGLVVDKNLNVNFTVAENPPHASSITLARLLKSSFANQMKAALTGAHLQVADTLEVKWLHF